MRVLAILAVVTGFSSTGVFAKPPCTKEVVVRKADASGAVTDAVVVVDCDDHTIRKTVGTLPPKCRFSQPHPFCTCTGRDANDLSIQSLEIVQSEPAPFVLTAQYSYNATIDMQWIETNLATITSLIYMDGTPRVQQVNQISASPVSWLTSARGPGPIQLQLTLGWGAPNSGSEYFWEQFFRDGQGNVMLCIRTGVFISP